MAARGTDTAGGAGRQRKDEWESFDPAKEGATHGQGMIKESGVKHASGKIENLDEVLQDVILSLRVR